MAVVLQEEADLDCPEHAKVDQCGCKSQQVPVLRLSPAVVRLEIQGRTPLFRIITEDPHHVKIQQCHNHVAVAFELAKVKEDVLAAVGVIYQTLRMRLRWYIR